MTYTVQVFCTYQLTYILSNMQSFLDAQFLWMTCPGHTVAKWMAEEGFKSVPAELQR